MKNFSAIKNLRFFLIFSTLAIYGVTYTAIMNQGLNWPAVAIHDLMSLNWRTQFDVDFIVHLFLLATWIIWREGATKKAYVYGFLSVIMGGMFSFPYLIYTTYIAGGDVKKIMLGTRVNA